MASDIRAHLNSNYVCRSNKFRKKPVIQVYVENDIDKVFWDTFLHPFEVQQNCQFRISTIRDRNKIQTGKLSILTYLEVSNSKRCKLGKYLWAC